MSESVKIKNESQDEKHFIITPQLIWAVSPSPYHYTFWQVVKSIAWISGECYLSTDQLATLCMMSMGKVSECRKFWIDSGLMKGEKRQDPGYPQPVWHLSIPNVWKANAEWAEKHPNIKDWIAFKLEQSLHVVKASPGEKGYAPHEKGYSPHETSIDINKDTNTEREEPGATAPTPPPPVPPKPPEKEPEPKEPAEKGLTEGQRYFLTSFGAKRFKNNIQKDAVLALERDHGTSRLKECIEWAAKKGMKMGDAITSIETAIPTWGNRAKSNGHRPAAPPAPPPPIDPDDTAERLFGAKVAEPEPERTLTPEEQRWEKASEYMREQLYSEGYKASWESHFEPLEFVAWENGILTLAADTEYNRAWLTSRMSGWMLRMVLGIAPGSTDRIEIVVRAGVPA